ncbi:MAG: nucleotidyltransferase family protein [SAR202 cluster bacterium]|nr:nucleotidyltransferase family protein [SAR202 cluster bacterium]
MTTTDIAKTVHEKREEILRIAAKHGAYNVRIFGSVARGDAGPDSDVDFLIDYGPNTSPWFPGGLIADLQDLLGRNVDVVTEKGLHRLVKDRVLAEAVPL